jgi:hypothetical protein
MARGWCSSEPVPPRSANGSTRVNASLSRLQARQAPRPRLRGSQEAHDARGTVPGGEGDGRKAPGEVAVGVEVILRSAWGPISLPFEQLDALSLPGVAGLVRFGVVALGFDEPLQWAQRSARVGIGRPIEPIVLARSSQVVRGRLVYSVAVPVLAAIEVLGIDRGTQQVDDLARRSSVPRLPGRWRPRGGRRDRRRLPDRGRGAALGGRRPRRSGRASRDRPGSSRSLS